MRTIAIPGTAMHVPIVGFGCSALSGVGKKNALRLLETAFDTGVRHFDVARYYGYGETEAIVGTFAKSRRADVTITTKVGIQPPRRTNFMRMALRAGRLLIRFAPAARRRVQRQAQGLVKGGRFGVKDAQASLETSLRELRTDHIDFYLLHDYEVSNDRPDELVSFLTRMVKAGKICNFGLATDRENIVSAVGQQPELCGVLQFENSVLTQNVKGLPCQEFGRFVITHGALAASYRAVSAFLETRTDAIKNWSAALDIDCSSGNAISALMLNYAAHANPQGLVLFSSQKASRISGNVKALLEPTVSTAQIELFAQLVHRDLTPSVQVD